MWYGRLWPPLLLLCSFSFLCHAMTVHAPRAVMVLISLDSDCEDYDWTVTLFGLSKTAWAQLTNWAAKNLLYLQIVFLFFGLQNSMCAAVECVFIFLTSLLSYGTWTSFCVVYKVSHHISEVLQKKIQTWCTEEFLCLVTCFYGC